MLNASSLYTWVTVTCGTSCGARNLERFRDKGTSCYTEVTDFKETIYYYSRRGRTLEL
jgi:hypothetical protein